MTTLTNSNKKVEFSFAESVAVVGGLRQRLSFLEDSLAKVQGTDDAKMVLFYRTQIRNTKYALGKVVAA